MRVAFATDSFATLVGPTPTPTPINSALPSSSSGSLGSTAAAAAADPATAGAPTAPAKPRPEWPPSFEEGAYADR